MSFHIRDNCRLCFSNELTNVLQLKPTPLANEFVHLHNINKKQIKYPLYLVQCNNCKHVQLPVVVNPSILFSNYLYVSGTSSSFVEHFRNYADETIRIYDLKPDDLVIEIGSNDGTLLNFFKQAGMKVLGIDPASDISKFANKSGVETLCEFFNAKTVELIKNNYGNPKVVIANNVFAHADDLYDIALGIKDLLEPNNGNFIFEVQYLPDLIKNTLFDMIYHEHLSYHSVLPLVSFFNKIGMRLINVKHVNTHGGSIRVSVSVNKKIKESSNVNEFINTEEISLHNYSFKAFGERINSIGEELRSLLKSENGSVIGYGAPAKLTTLMYQFKLEGPDFDYIVDDSPWKQGLFSPGLHIPVVPASHMVNSNIKPSKVVIFAWNYAENIAKNFPQFKGRFIKPLPFLKVF
jgi:2-polyprenyl-3-methyl-5-hydroxy-6-metoxy-1,4-benzoquinol methylase